jgi:pimeloyl-ACP methyl ester carboxylesterase
MKQRVYISLLLCFWTISVALSAPAKYSFGIRIVGQGKPMILIPGLKGSSDTYNDLVAHYKNRYKCYIITLAGFAGQPPSDAHDHLFQKQRDDIITYIIDNHLKRPVIVGFSFGGTLATWIAVTRPDLTGLLVNIDSTPCDGSMRDELINKDSLLKADSAKYAAAIVQPTDYWKKRDSIYHSPAVFKQGDARVWRMLSDTIHFNETAKWDFASDFRSAVLMRIEADTIDMRQSVAGLQFPVLVLGSWVGKGYPSKDEAAKDYAQLWKNAKQTTIVFSEKGKHFLMYEDLEWMLRQMDIFFNSYKVKSEH